MNDSDLAIRATGLTKTSGSTTAPGGLDRPARRGTVLGVLGVLGPNGAGKTTAVRIFATLSRPDAGQAWTWQHSFPLVARPPRGARARSCCATTRNCRSRGGPGVHHRAGALRRARMLPPPRPGPHVRSYRRLKPRRTSLQADMSADRRCLSARG